MSRKNSIAKTTGLLTVIALSLIAYAVSMHATPIANAAASYSGAVKPMEFYFHNTPTPLSLGGGYTSDNHIMNTTRLWGGTQRIGPQSGTFDIYFYTAPDLAGNWPVNGTFWLHLWANATGSTPSAVFTITVYELNASGFFSVGSWNSGNQNLSPTIYDVNAIPGNSPLKFAVPSYTFKPGSSIVLKTTIKPGASTEVSVWYDSAQYPSRVIIYAEDYARPLSVKTYWVDNSETNLFYYNWSDSQRKVIVRANVTDPLGGYDIYKVNMTILDPAGNPVVDNADMIRVSDGQWRVNYFHLFEANWTYPSTAQLGNYTVNVWVIDNNGYYRNLDSPGSFAPFIETNDHVFSIGIIVYYDPAFLVVDDVDAPLPHAQVFITWPNGSMDKLPRYTAANGFINLTHVLPADYGFTILWKDVVVKQETVHVGSNGPYTIKTEVFQLTVTVLGNSGGVVYGAYVIVYTQTGVGYGLDTTDASGKAVFKVPKGTYNLEAHFSTDYWLTVVTTKAEASVSVASSRSETIVLANYPPPIWSTTGFWLIMALVAVVIIAAVFIVFRSRIGLPMSKRRR